MTSLAVATLVLSLVQAGAARAPVELAYIDLGTGSMIIQILAAGALSAAVAFRRLRMQIMFLLSRPFKRRQLPEGAAATTAPTDGPTQGA